LLKFFTPKAVTH